MDKFIDLSNEVSTNSQAMDTITKKKAWLASDIDETNWVLRLPDAALEEVGIMIDTFAMRPLPMLLRRPDQHHIPNLTNVYAKVKEICDNGIGFETSAIKKTSGLANTENRTKDVGGSFTFETKPDAGFSAKIKIPS